MKGKKKKKKFFSLVKTWEAILYIKLDNIIDRKMGEGFWVLQRQNMVIGFSEIKEKWKNFFFHIYSIP